MPEDQKQSSRSDQEELHSSLRQIRAETLRCELRQHRRRILGYLLLSAAILVPAALVAGHLYQEYSHLDYKLHSQSEVIDSMEQRLLSLRLQEQEREEELLRAHWSSHEVVSEDLSLEVAENLALLRSMLDPARSGENLSRGNTDFKEIALTFDLGSGNELERLYHYLHDHDIRATLFVSNETPSYESGSMILPRNVHWIRKLAESGRVEFGNHTWSHFNLPRSVTESSGPKRAAFTYLANTVIDANDLIEETRLVEERFTEITGHKLSPIYRLPYGALSRDILDFYAVNGYSEHIFWTSNHLGGLDIKDYVARRYIPRYNPQSGKREMVRNPLYMSRGEALEYLYRWEREDPHGMNGAIILMHLGSPRRTDILFDILPQFIETMQEKGYRFVTTSEVFNDRLD